MRKVISWFAELRRFSDRIWYLPVIGLLAAADIFLLVIPVDGLLISTVLLRPRHWVRASIWVSAGSAAGGWMMGIAVRLLGETGVEAWMGLTRDSVVWEKTTQFIANYGMTAMGLVAVGPFPLPPGVLIAAAAGMSPGTLFSAVLIGRLARNGIFAWIASHAPRLLSRLRGVQREIKKLDAPGK